MPHEARYPEPREWEEGLSEEIKKLRWLGQQLRFFGQIAPMITVLNFAAMVGVWGMRLITSHPDYMMMVMLLSAILTVACMFLMASFDALRRRGDAAFEELSDEYQWYLRKQAGEKFSSQPPEKPPLGIRLVLRNFSYSCDLPLIPGRAGPALYVVVNAIITLISALSAIG